MPTCHVPAARADDGGTQKRYNVKVIIQRAYKTELDPNDAQATLFRQYAGAARFVYNWALNDRIERYKDGQQNTNVFEQKRRFNALKHEQFPWLQGVSYKVVEQAFANLDRAYQNFFRRVKQDAGKKGFPHFKSKKHGLGTFTLRDISFVEPTRIKLPRLGWIRLKEEGYLPCIGVKILSANISEQAGRWFISLQVEQEIPDPEPRADKVIGVDLGIKALATCSDGKVFENPRILTNAERRLRRAQRQMSRRKLRSANWHKAKRKVARLHYRVGCIRCHVQHEITSYLTVKAKPSVIVIEDLHVKGMLKNRHLAKAVSDASFGELRRQLEYKAKWHGIQVVTADMWYPSSKRCSACGSIKPLLKLSEREYVCEVCGAVMDRDMNAAMNLAELAAKPAVPACGGGVSPAESGPSPVKQEPGTDKPVNPGGSRRKRGSPSRKREGARVVQLAFAL